MAEKNLGIDRQSASPKPIGSMLSDVLRMHADGNFKSPLYHLSERCDKSNKLKLLQKDVGRRYAECSFDNYHVFEETSTEQRPSQREVFNRVRYFANDVMERSKDEGGLVLFGAVGTGKDHLMIASAYVALWKFSVKVKWVNVSTLVEETRDLFKAERLQKNLIETYSRVPILAMSDLTPQKGETSPFLTDVILRIIDIRYRNLRPTWVTMNARDGDEARQVLADPIVDRLRHNSLCLPCQWTSARKPAELS
jgi:DNA replication protein DnaC